MEKKDEIKLVAAKGFETNSSNYLIVDFLNKNLKEFNLIFGLTRTDESDIITIYKIAGSNPAENIGQ
jgi:hypothetical protein